MINSDLESIFQRINEWPQKALDRSGLFSGPLKHFEPNSFFSEGYVKAAIQRWTDPFHMVSKLFTLHCRGGPSERILRYCPNFRRYGHLDQSFEGLFIPWPNSR